MICCLASLISVYQLQAEKAKYDGKDLILSEAIEIMHPAGRLSACRAVLQNFKMDRRSPFQKISLSGQVCVHAIGSDRDINLFADRASGEIDAGALFAFQNLRCQGNVEITTSDGFCAKGGEARFSALANRGGMFELIPAPLSQYCIVSHELDHLEARKVRLDIETKKMVCEEPQGEIHAGWKNDAAISFKAKRLIWQQDLLLEEDVVLESAVALRSEQIRISFAPNSKRTIQEIATNGITQIDFSNQETSLVCQGPLILDPASRTIRTAGSLQFQDERIHLESDYGWLIYREEEGRLQPDAIYCEGSVRLISSSIQDQETFALGEQLAYFPAAQTIILTSRSPNRVLFWQSGKTMTLSAPEVQVRLDPKTKQEIIQGVGDVHFHFSVQEEDMIENVFSKYL
jgi:hypothetical protein